MLKAAFIGFTLFLGAAPSPARAQADTPPEQLIQYVRDAKKGGLKDTQIQQNAIKAGWPAQDVTNALEAVVKNPAKPVAAATNPTAANAQTDGVPSAKAAETPTTPAAPAAEGAAPVAGVAAEGAKSEQPVPENSSKDMGVPKTSPINRGVPYEYHIGEGDVIQINVWGEPTASVGSVVVRPDGKITMPLVKDISVAGLTPAEAEATITEQLSKQIKAADVTVIVNQINSKKIFVVGGGIKKEGPINFTYRMTVMQAISEAGGLSDYAKRKKIYVLRNENGRQYQLKFDYDAVLKGEHMETNIPLIAGDTLVVPNH